MQQSSENIGEIAAALARAQANLTNPEKSLTAIIRSPFPREEDRTFRYASLASGLEIVRKTLSQQDIATIQTTRTDPATGKIHLTTTLAHSSGEWISSDWPVITTADTDAPHRMGMALTYARRYSLFALVGIAGEDDLDAPDLAPASSALSQSTTSKSKVSNKPLRSGTLDAEGSSKLRDQLLTEILALQNENELLQWAGSGLSKKNTLLEPDTEAIEAAYKRRLNEIDSASATSAGASTEPSKVTSPDLAIPKEQVRRSKAHLQFVRGQPCLICKKLPCDPHHLKFAQPRALGRKVSDEYTVPLCRAHHNDLHRHGNEKSWWANLQIEPLAVAKELWGKRPIDGPSSLAEIGL